MKLRDAKLGDHPKYFMPEPEEQEKSAEEQVIDMNAEEFVNLMKSDETYHIEADLLHAAAQPSTSVLTIMALVKLYQKSVFKDVEEGPYRRQDVHDQ